MGWYDRFLNRLRDVRSSFNKTWKTVLDAPTFSAAFETFFKGMGYIIDHFFGGTQILFLGPVGAGKTTLIQYLTDGVPPVDIAPTPIGPPMAVGRKPEIGNVNGDLDRIVIGISSDVSGESRDFWQEMLDMINPEGLIILMDGTADYNVFRREYRKVLQDIVPVYANGARHLRVIYTFLNKYDMWRHQESRKHKLCSILNDEIANVVEASPVLGSIKWGSAETQLSPSATSWPEVDQALNHFKTDLARKH
jgi:hypothetical protein